MLDNPESDKRSTNVYGTEDDGCDVGIRKAGSLEYRGAVVEEVIHPTELLAGLNLVS